MKDKSIRFFKTIIGNDRISTRFRNLNVVIFAVVSACISFAMLFELNYISNSVSKDYAKLYSSNTAATLDTYFGSEIALMKKAARSSAVIEWFEDEDNQAKKLEAYEEMMETIDSLSSKNLYIGLAENLHEYTIEEYYTVDDIQPFGTLRPDYYDDAWYFECVASDKDYLLNVDIDKILHRKRVWLNYKVTRDGEVLGVLCTWLEFSNLVEKLFAEYDCTKVRGLVTDQNGVIHMDSALLGNENFLNYTIEDDLYINDEFSDPVFLSAFNAYIEKTDGYYDLDSATTVIELPRGKYRYATIAPIVNTTWSVVTFYNASTLFGIANLLPLLTMVLAMLIVFVIVTGFMSNKLIFEPFEKLTRSIARIKANKNENIYGIERRDEIGNIANTVQDMKDSLIDALDKMHYDALTGIYNRRYLAENLSRVIKSLARTSGVLSVMMIDVDFFKDYNDTYGHDMGDACLKIIANTLVASIGRADDFVARYGGEEFAIIMPHTDEHGARIVAEKLIENVNACNIPHEKNTAANIVTISIGVTTDIVAHPQSGENYIKRADEALYMSKRNGRNKYTFIPLHDK